MPQSGHQDTEDRERTIAAAVSDLIAEELAQREAQLYGDSSAGSGTGTRTSEHDHG
jgi:hypothetical protein